MLRSLKLMAAAGVMSLGVSAAQANPISLYYSLDGSTYTQLGATSTTGFAQYAGSIGASSFSATFSAVGTATGTTPLPPPDFNTSTIAITSTGAGVLYLAALETGITNTNVGSFNVSFGGNAGNPGTIQEMFTVGSSLSLGSAPLLSYTLAPSTPNASLSVAAPVLTSPYMVAEQFKITFTSAGTIQGTIQEHAVVPEPISIALLGSGLVGLGMIRRRKSI